MHYLYGLKGRRTETIGRNICLRTTVAGLCGVATLDDLGDHRGKFEQGTVLASFNAWECLNRTADC